MKVIKYNLCVQVNRGTEEAPVYEDVLSAVEMTWNETNEQTARREAHGGVYTIEEVEDQENNVPDIYDELAAAITEGVNAV